MAQSRYYSATAQPTVLTAGITPSSTIINVQQTVGFPASTPYILALDYGSPSEEVVLVTAAAGTSLTVTRAYDGTAATSHNSGAAVRHTWTALDGNDSRSHEAATSSVHGVSTIVGTTEVQTLTNKTLTNPVINGTVAGGASYTAPTLTSPSITGTVGGSASYTSPTITGTVGGSASYTSPTLTGTVGGSATYTSPTLNTATANDLLVRNSAIGNVSLTVNAIAGTSTTLMDVQLNGTSRFSISTNGQALMAAQSTATTPMLVRSPNATSVDVARWQINSVDQVKITSTGNLQALQGAGIGTAQQFNVDSSGNVTAAGNITVGAWVSFTPTWTSTGTAPAIGNGTLVGRYSLQGKTCTFTIGLTFGTTTTAGTGTYAFALPFTAVTRAGNAWIGQALVTDSGVASTAGACQIVSAGTTVIPVGPSNSTTTNNGAGWGATSPFTFGTNDSMYITATYEIA